MPPSAPPPVYEPIRTRRTFEAVCDRIRAQLRSGELQPGDRLPGERELAERFGVGRSTARDALRSLEAAGVVQARTGVQGGFFIHAGDSGGIARSVQDMLSLAQTPIESVTEARIEITCVATRLACQRGTAEDFDAIQRDVDHHRELFREGHASRSAKSVTEFYRLVARATHNDVLVMMVDALTEVTRSLVTRVDPRPSEDIMAARQRIVDLMRQRNAPAACDAMAVYLRQVADYLASEDTVKRGRARPSPSRAGK